MALSAFDDRSREPKAAEVEQILGRSAVHWRDLVDHLADRFTPLTSEWIFSGAKWGWSLRLKHKKRTILYLTPGRRAFLVGFALGEKAVAVARESDLPSSVMELIEGARKYAEGRAVRLDVRNRIQSQAVKRLAAIKMAN